MNNPLKNVFNIRRSELPMALVMSFYFFLVITSFWVLKPIKKWLFIEYYDTSGFNLLDWHLTASQAELLAKVLNMIVAFFAVVIFTLLVRKLKRQQLTYVFTGFFMISYIGYSLVIDKPVDITVWSFYLFGDLFSTLMVATFFAFLNDSVSPDAAKRLYGIIGLGGVMGGAFGSSFVNLRIKAMIKSAEQFGESQLSMASWMWICFAIGIMILIVGYIAGRLVNKESDVNIVDDTPEDKTGKKRESAVFEGGRMVFRSSYLLAIVGIVGLYEIVSTVLDFQFTATIAHYLDGAAIGRQFSLMYTVTNWFSLFVQLLLTSFVMTRFGITVALMMLPIACL